MNQASERRLEKVHPELARRVRAIIEEMARQGHTVEVTQGMRTFAEQDALFAQGRTRPGPVVTRARGGQSNHNFGTAVDLCPFVNGKPDWNAPPAVWLAIGTEAVRQGLEWGGNWPKFIDKPHVQMAGPSISRCLTLFNTGGLDKVWAAFS